MKLSISKLLKWLGREVIPIALLLCDVESEARSFARRNDLPEEACVELAKCVKMKLIEELRG